LKQAADTGRIDLPPGDPVQWPVPAFSVADGEDKDYRLWTIWIELAHCLAVIDPELPNNPHVLRPGGTQADDWGLRAKNYAVVCDHLADRLDQRSETGRPAKARRKPGDLNGAMLAYIMEHPENRGYTAEQFGVALRAHPSQIVNQPAWKALEQFRQVQCIERQKAKRQGRAAK
jgi:hypothetical protein